MIATSRQGASRAIVPTIHERFGHALPTNARLRRSAWVYLHQHSPGAFSLVREHLREGAPSRIVNRLGQYSTGETLYVQILDGDYAVLVDQLARQFVLKVSPLVPHVGVRALEQPHSLAPSVAALLPPRH